MGFIWIKPRIGSRIRIIFRKNNF